MHLVQHTVFLLLKTKVSSIDLWYRRTQNRKYFGPNHVVALIKNKIIVYH